MNSHPITSNNNVSLMDTFLSDSTYLNPVNIEPQNIFSAFILCFSLYKYEIQNKCRK